MKLSIKKLLAVVLGITVATTSIQFSQAEAVAKTTSAARWSEYWEGISGNPDSSVQAAVGYLTSNTDSGWTAYYEAIGGTGIWGAQVKDEHLYFTAGYDYKISFDLFSTDLDKWVFVQVGDEADPDYIIFGKWIKVGAGRTVHVEESFMATHDATFIRFGIGGDPGNIPEEHKLYQYAVGKVNDGDPLGYTDLKCSNFEINGYIRRKPNPIIKKIKVKKLTLRAAKKVKVGKKIAIKAVIKPGNATNKKLKWSVSNKRWATISSKGVLTAKKAGRGKTVIVTCKTRDGSKKTAKIKVKIVK